MSTWNCNSLIVNWMTILLPKQLNKLIANVFVLIAFELHHAIYIDQQLFTRLYVWVWCQFAQKHFWFYMKVLFFWRLIPSFNWKVCEIYSYFKKRLFWFLHVCVCMCVKEFIWIQKGWIHIVTSELQIQDFQLPGSYKAEF